MPRNGQKKCTKYSGGRKDKEGGPEMGWRRVQEERGGGERLVVAISFGANPYRKLLYSQTLEINSTLLSRLAPSFF